MLIFPTNSWLGCSGSELEPSSSFAQLIEPGGQATVEYEEELSGEIRAALLRRYIPVSMARRLSNTDKLLSQEDGVDSRQ